MGLDNVFQEIEGCWLSCTNRNKILIDKISDLIIQLWITWISE